MRVNGNKWGVWLSLATAWLLRILSFVLCTAYWTVGAEKAQNAPVKGRAANTIHIDVQDGQVILDGLINVKLVKISRKSYGFSGSDFYISETEITNEMYMQFLKATNRRKDDRQVYETHLCKRGDAIASTGPLVQVHSLCNLWENNRYPQGRALMPVGMLTIEDAEKFCLWVDSICAQTGWCFRLPTQTEWLIAAYGKERLYPWGSDFDSSFLGWAHSQEGYLSAEEVKQRAKGCTPEGVFGLWGNVSEYVLPDNVVKNWKLYRDNPEYRYEHVPFMGGSFADTGYAPGRRYWGFVHGPNYWSDGVGFRIVYVPKEKDK